MQENQSSLGNRRIHRTPAHTQSKIGRVTSIKDYRDYGKIEVVFLDYGMPFPVWVVGDLDREPVTGDQVIVGYMEGRKDAPYLAGFVKNESYTSNFVQVSMNKIRLQLPVFEVGVRGGDAHKEAQSGLTSDQTLKHHRAYVELTPDHALISFPHDSGYSASPVTIKLTKAGVIEMDANSIEMNANSIDMNAGTVTVRSNKGTTTL
jgi:hypothetical protein